VPDFKVDPVEAVAAFIVVGTLSVAALALGWFLASAAE
jgi:hypothetical protein